MNCFVVAHVAVVATLMLYIVVTCSILNQLYIYKVRSYPIILFIFGDHFYVFAKLKYWEQKHICKEQGEAFGDDNENEQQDQEFR